MTMAKGQMRSNREAKKPKKSAADKAKQKAGGMPSYNPNAKNAPDYSKKG